MKTNEIENEIQDIVSEIKSLNAKNAELSKAGHWFSAEQRENGKRSWELMLKLRFDHNMEPGTY